jgi:FkbM family methyltransferase
MSGPRRVLEKIRNIEMLLAAAETPLPLVLDSLHMQRRPYIARLRNGLGFALDPGCGDWFTLLECAVRQDYLQHGIVVREGDTVLDIGANFGGFSLIASRMAGESGRILSYEPNPAVFQRLLRNIRMNDCRNVTAFNEAVQGQSGEIEFFISPKPAFSTTSPQVDGRVSRARPTMVPMRSIASVLAGAAGPVALIKMDCEGAEYDILNSLTADAAAIVGQVVVEVHRVPGHAVDEIPHRLRELGFDVRHTTPLTAFRPR